MYIFTGYSVIVVLILTVLSYFLTRFTVRCVKEKNRKDAIVLGSCLGIVVVINIAAFVLAFVTD